MFVRRSKFVWLFLGPAVLLLSVSMLVAQTEEGTRKATRRVTPPYPELAKRMRASGTVKLEVAVSPEGEVKQSKVIGGTPVFINAAEDAVKRWKFEPASKATSEVVTFHFSPE